MAQQPSFQHSRTRNTAPRYGASDAVWLELSVLVATPDQAEAAPNDPPSAMECPTYFTILVVDNEPDMRVYLKGCLRLLKGSVGPVLEAPDGEAALETIRRLTPNLVISEVRIPKLDGFMLCRALRADAALRHIPVFLISSEAPIKAIREQARKAGAIGFLNKPFNARRLCAELESLLRLSRTGAASSVIPHTTT